MDAPLSVKRLLEQIKTRLEPAFAAVCVVGEVSNFRGSGKHWYFTLKEEGAALSCAVWASQQRFLQHRPADGQRVVLKGSLNLYVAGGTLTLAVTHCELAGAGDLQARLRQLEAELRAQGLFDRPKRSLPRFPRKLGVVAALGGAALRDVLEVMGRRAPGIHVLIAPAAAQGERCVPETLLALQELQDPHWGCEALLLVRGGGSLEDLWAFNDPELVRAVAECRIPVITGVGHEIDTTLVDLAADRRAATPSQAAELATPDRSALGAELRRRVDALCAKVLWRLQGQETTLNLLTDHGLQRVEPVAPAQSRFGALTQRLALAHPSRGLDGAAARLALLRQRLGHLGAQVAGEADLPRVRDAQRRLEPALLRALQRRDQRLAVMAERLQGLDPSGPLERGFVLALGPDGRPVTRAEALPAGAGLRLRWKDGERRARLD
ncbi:MAG: exodeoxyribonuclease VII large subunit [Geothrix sp.]|uniref:Exodeoxyribonuclease 7 large subunit n=1 Tax=Candidatus Geothrix odensensis TaxID=2954440 RepID=A0A936F2D3_9BACT|nr:exodeoxyribonuclease VII large subunit [Candidatus Geothrix odensensis]MCC6513217.1 exodeoxyribonuclease VII large subunit [Geothrix sp.]